MTLNRSQQDAVERLGQDVCVVAGPGSGKTRVLVERFRWLVEAKGVSPLRILAITFTEKAATEIKERLGKAFAGRPELRSEIERAYVSTIHGFGARLLREHSIAAGLDPDFSVMEETESRAELAGAAHEALEELFQERPSEMRSLLAAVHVSTYEGGRHPDLAESLTRIYAALRSAGRTVEDAGKPRKMADWKAALSGLLNELDSVIRTAPPARTDAQKRRIHGLSGWLESARPCAVRPLSVEHFRVLDEFRCDLRGLKRGDAYGDALRDIRDVSIPNLKRVLAGAYYAPLHALLAEALRRLDANYKQRKRARSALDFPDLEERTIELLTAGAGVRSIVSRRFDYILMDELQDTNRLQWKLLDLIRTTDRFFAVGDINQSIYGFRHADPEVFREYRDGIEAARKTIDRLHETHRSRGEILAAVGSIFQAAGGIDPHHLEAKREFAPKTAPSVELIIASGDKTEDALRLEAAWIARRIRELQGTLLVQEDNEQRPARYRDFAVLVRSVKALPPIEEAFGKFGIRYLTVGGKKFFEGREVRDLTHLLRIIANPRDEVSLAGVLRSPLVGVSDETLLRLKQLGNLADALAEAGPVGHAGLDAEDLEKLERFYLEFVRMRTERDDISPERLLLRAMDASGYEDTLDARARSNLDKFLALVRDWFHRTPGPAAELVRELQQLRDFQAEPDAPPDDSSDVVRLMSIHQSKGLQFPVVFVAALHKGTSGAQPPILLGRDGALGVDWRNPATGEGLKDDAHNEASELAFAREAKEENRLLYVAMTRAQDHLVLSYANTKRIQSSWPELVISGLEVDPDRVDNRPIEQLCDGRAPIRLLRVDAPPDRMEAPAPQAPEAQEGQVLHQPAISDQHDSAATVTSVMTFGQCPRRYYLGRYIGWQDPGPRAAFLAEDDEAKVLEFDEPGGAEFGAQVHGLLAGAPKEGASPAALELRSRFERSTVGRRAARAGRVEREFDFLMALDDVVLRGQIDLWFEEGGQLVLVDYKTDEVPRGAESVRAESYAVQLRLYALALERIAGRMPEEAFLYLLRPDVAVPVDLSAPRLAEVRDLVRAFRDAQSGLRFDLREGEQCRRCPFYRGLCPAGREELTAGRRTSSSRQPS